MIGDNRGERCLAYPQIQSRQNRAPFPVVVHDVAGHQRSHLPQKAHKHCSLVVHKQSVTLHHGSTLLQPRIVHITFC